MELHPDLRSFELADRTAARLRDARPAPVVAAHVARPRQRLGRILIQAGLRLAPDARPALVR